MMIISTNKNEYNVRRVSELTNRLQFKKEELSNAKGFFKRLKLKAEVNRLNKLIDIHGKEVLQYEYNKTKESFK